jgi:hypothetical protein
MKSYSYARSFLLLAVPLLASSMVATASQAATFASASGDLNLTNFSQSPTATDAITDSNTLAISKSGIVNAFAQAEASFLIPPPVASTSSLSQAFGEGEDYLGLAQSQAQVIGNFIVDAGKTLSFNFDANLNLKTSIDDPNSENAKALGDVLFALLDTKNQSQMDFFGLFGNINTPSNKNFVASQHSQNVTLNNSPSDSSFGKDKAFLQASTSGLFKHQYLATTKLTLIQFTRNESQVSAPEPGSNLALLLLGALITVGMRSKRITMLELTECR